MKIGYARVSTDEQNANLQIDALQKAGVARKDIYVDTISGSVSSKKRPALQSAISHLRAGDTLIVWRLDRLGRSLIDLINLINQLKELEVNFISLDNALDTSSANGKLIFYIMAALAEFERELIRERTRAGLKSARARGHVGGRPRTLDKKKHAALHMAQTDTGKTVREICAIFGISEPTFYRYQKAETEKHTNEEASKQMGTP